MKALLFVAMTAFCVFAASSAQAAQAIESRNGNVTSIYLHAARGSAFGGNLNDRFDSVGFAVTTATGVMLTNITSGNAPGVGPRPPGEPFTYRNRVLDADPLDDGLGWSILGQTINAEGANWGGGPLGQTINTGPAGGPGLFLMNLHFNAPANRAGFIGQVQLLSAGNIIATMPFIPEPASFCGACIGMVSLAGLRRRLPK